MDLHLFDVREGCTQSVITAVTIKKWCDAHLVSGKHQHANVTDTPIVLHEPLYTHSHTADAQQRR